MARHFILFTVLFHITMASVPTINLNDGNKMPVLGLGTAGSNYGQSDKDKLRQAINWAVEAGYRHIDTAAIYDNEEQIGQGIADVIGNGIVKREDLFVTTKLWNDKHARDQVVPALRESLRKLGLNYVDLYLIHFPTAEKADGSPENIDYLDTWKSMEEAKKLGLAKSIGVSNFDDKQIDRLIANSNIRPAVNQVEVSPTNTQKQLVSHCQELGIAIMAYSPFGFLVNRQTSDSPVNLNYAPLEGIAKKYNKTNTQIILRYLIERGLVPIPKSTNRGRICENINVFDFQLTDDEIEVMDNYNLNKSVFP